MAKTNSLLEQRLKGPQHAKVQGLAERSAGGSLSSFAGIFRVAAPNEEERASLMELLETYAPQEHPFQNDLPLLASITSEVKAIHNQAVILHGERIKRAQELLKKYREGAFTAWLIATYGNRQTPYNFLQYYELHTSLSPALQSSLEAMPRHAAYLLASRPAPIEKKESLLRAHQGASRDALVALIRSTFPLARGDLRAADGAGQAIQLLTRLLGVIKEPSFHPTAEQKNALTQLLDSLRQQIDER